MQTTVAGLLARGRSARSVARQLPIGRDTIRRWQKDAEFIAEYERVLARGGAPDPHGTLLDALSARKDDDIDWPSRLRAALTLLELDGDRDREDDAVVSGDW